MKFLAIILSVILEIIPAGDAFVRQLQQRDSILIADQLQYGFVLDSLDRNVGIALPDYRDAFNDTLTLVSNWQIDTLAINKKKGLFRLEAYMTLAPFEEGQYQLPELLVLKKTPLGEDTLYFASQQIEVKTMPVDTATFQIHDLKPQMRYPVTFSEVLPWALSAIALAAIVVLIVFLVRRSRSRKLGESAPDEPAYIVALRRLEQFRSDKYWASDKQKSFYSGVTDALKFYIEDRFGVDAPEMTTAELFKALKSSKDITPDLFSDTREIFEMADYVKFAKHLATDDENARVIPVAVRFVTSTYQVYVESQAADQQSKEGGDR